MLNNKESEYKLAAVSKRLKELDNFAVAFSGGVDSTFLLAVSKQVRPRNLIAITVSSQFVPRKAVESAKRTAKSVKVKHICLDVDILKNPEIKINSFDRCYHCKKQLFALIKKTAENLGVCHMLHAVNLDDLGDFRPGLKAAEELNFLAPLADAGLTKQEIRYLSRQMGLETWNKPSQSCLATRIPYDTIITGEDLAGIEKAEDMLHDMGFEQVRVRCHGKLARIEVEEARIRKISEKETRHVISSRFSEIGFAHTSIDIDGYASGKMNTGFKKD